MRILVLSSRFPYPIEKGDKLRLYNQMKGLAKQHELHLFSITEEKILDDHLLRINDLCESVTINSINRLGSFVQMSAGTFNNIPFQCQYFYRASIQKDFNELIERIQPEIIYCQLVRMAEYCRKIDVPKIIDYMDAFSLNMERRIDFESFPMRQFYKNEAKRLAKYEKEIIKDFNLATIISDQDKDHLLKKDHKSDNKIEVVSNGLDIEFYQAEEGIAKKDLLFVGNMGYHPNVLAAEFIVKKIMPGLSKESTLTIAGTRPTPRVKALASKNVKVTGWIKDIRDAYNGSNIFVAPIFSGAGQQNKILEAMAMGLCCVTTSSVNNAIGSENGEHLLIADTKEEFIDQIRKLQKNETLMVNMGKKAKEFVKSNFSWESTNKQLNNLFNMITS